MTDEVLARGRASAHRLESDIERRRAFIQAYGELRGRLRLRADMRVVDVGCGPGEGVEALAPHVQKILGIDISPEIVEVARSALVAQGYRNVTFVTGDICSQAWEFSAELIVSLTALDEMADKSAALTNMRSMLQPGGMLYVEVRNENYILKRSFRWLGGLLRRSGLLISFAVPGFRDLTYEQWMDVFDSTGFRLVDNFRSIRPAYGFGLQRVKSSLARFSRYLPIKHRYMLAFLLTPAAGGDGGCRT